MEPVSPKQQVVSDAESATAAAAPTEVQSPSLKTLPIHLIPRNLLSLQSPRPKLPRKPPRRLRLTPKMMRRPLKLEPRTTTPRPSRSRSLPLEHEVRPGDPKGFDIGRSVTGLDHQIAVITAQQAKGLEFDSVVIVEPGRIAPEAPRWVWSALCVVYRTTDRLRILASGADRAVRAHRRLRQADLPVSQHA